MIECPDCGMPDPCWCEQTKREAAIPLPALHEGAGETVSRETVPVLVKREAFEPLCAFCDARTAQSWVHDPDGRLCCDRCVSTMRKKYRGRRR
jgi:hypothetical protein